MTEFPIHADKLNGMGKAELKGLLFQKFDTLLIAESDESMQGLGSFCQIYKIVYFRTELGKPLCPFIDQNQLDTILPVVEMLIQNRIAQSNAFTAYNASTATALPSGTGVKSGHGFYVTASGTVNGDLFTANDVFFAKIDNPTTMNDFGDRIPVASIATASIAGVVRIANSLVEYTSASPDVNVAVSVAVLKYLLNDVNTTLGTKVDKVAGKQLSTEDYSTIEKTKLTGISTGATANNTDANLRDRTTHTGVQAIGTVTDLQTALDAKIPFIVSATFAAIPAQSGANYKMILVLVDETNGNISTFYFYDGAGLQWLPTSKLY